MKQATKRLGAVARSERGQYFLWTVAACVVALAVLDALLWYLLPVPPGVVELSICSDVETEVQVHFDTGQGISPQESVTLPLAPLAAFRTLRFPLPVAPVKALRIDPLTAPGTSVIASIRLVRERDGELVRELPVDALKPMDTDTEVIMGGDGLHATREGDATGSPLYMSLAKNPLSMQRASRQRATDLLLLDALVLGLCVVVSYPAFLGWRPRAVRPVAGAGVRRWRPWLSRWFADGWQVALWALPLVCLAAGFALTQRASYYLSAMVTCDRPAAMQFYFDEGTGFNETLSCRVEVKPSAAPQEVRFPVPVNSLAGLRFDPADGPVHLRLTSLRLRSRAERWLHRSAAHVFDLRAVSAGDEIKDLVHEPLDPVEIVTNDNARNPTTTLSLAAPINFGVNWFYVFYRTALYVPLWLLLWVGTVEASRRFPVGRAFAGVRGIWRRLTPVQAVWVVAAASAVLSCYPVIFCGKSFASPNFADDTFQLYGKFPTLPGTADAELEDSHGADVGTMARQAIPDTVVASRAVWKDGEWPLWNRYNFAGLPLYGQGQSMVGDPLQVLVLAAGGRAWAWDVKFVVAKGFFCAGVGLLVLAATESVGAALLLSFSAAFLGFFVYRLNHPAIFSECYAPWILLAWVRLVLASSWRGAMRAGGLLLLANWAELNSGTAKEASMLMLCLNLCGVLMLLISHWSVQEKFWRFLGLAWAGVIFCLLASPFFLAFFDTLRQCISNYDAPHAWQIQPGMFIGLFDDIFYRQFVPSEHHFDLSANFLVLVGVLFALGGITRLAGNRLFAATALSALLPLSLAFGVVPPSFIREVPILGNIAHIDNTFSSVLLIELLLLAGFGLRQCLALASRRAWKRDVSVALLLGAVFLGVYFGHAQAAEHDQVIPFLKLNEEVPRSLFFYVYTATLVLAAGSLPFLLRRLALRGARPAEVILLTVCLLLIHWRHGLHVHNRFSAYTGVVPNRINLLATSPTVEYLHADRSGAFRTFGLGDNLMPGFSGVVGLENINGPDASRNPYFHDIEVAGLKLDEDWSPTAADKDRIAAVRPFFDLLNIRYCLALTEENLNGVPGFELVRELDMKIFRNATAWPRAFFTDRLAFYQGAEDFAQQVMAGNGQPFAAVDINELRDRPDLAHWVPPDIDGRAVVPGTNYRLTNNTTRFDLEVPHAGVIVLTEAYMDHDIVARLNGRQEPVFRINHAFRGVKVDRAGHYRVSFTYRPRGFTLTLWAAGLGAVLLAHAVWRFSRRDRTDASGPLAPAAPLAQG